MLCLDKHDALCVEPRGLNMPAVRSRNGKVGLPVKVLLSLTPETHERLLREAEAEQSSVAGVARAMILRTLAQNDRRRPTERLTQPDMEERAVA
jgi:hypothetical protein